MSDSKLDVAAFADASPPDLSPVVDNRSPTTTTSTFGRLAIERGKAEVDNEESNRPNEDEDDYNEDVQ
jgi:hypothetical protein